MSRRKKGKQGGGSLIASNRRARRDYLFEEEYEAGIVLTGSEVKSLRAAQVHLKEAYGLVRRGEMWLAGMHIAPYQMARGGGHDPVRDRKLLLHSREIERISRRIQEKGMAAAPIEMYWKNGRVKVRLGVGRGARRYDKRQQIKAREMKREADRAASRRGRSQPR